MARVCGLNWWPTPTWVCRAQHSCRSWRTGQTSLRTLSSTIMRKRWSLISKKNSVYHLELSSRLPFDRCQFFGAFFPGFMIVRPRVFLCPSNHSMFLRDPDSSILTVQPIQIYLLVDSFEVVVGADWKLTLNNAIIKPSLPSLSTVFLVCEPLWSSDCISPDYRTHISLAFVVC